MKKFILQTILFLLISTLLIAVLTCGVYFTRSWASFKLPLDKNILVVGDSHTECAIDDEIFSRTTNVSRSSSPYWCSYCKIKKFMDENRHVDTVILSFSYAMLRSTIDDQWTFDETWMLSHIPCYLSLVDKDILASYASKKVSLLKAILDLPYRDAFTFIARGDRLSYKDLDIGHYAKLDRDKLQEALADPKYLVEDKSLSLHQKKYLLKIVDLCKSRNVELILINTPIYKPEIHGDLDLLKAYHNAYLSGIKYMDYSAFPLPDSCYGDIDHLNYKGAEIFSKYLQENFLKDVAALSPGS
ncbi:MAG: hypothetical protein LBF09_00055 [Odoribacteraceae bacterium]|jgi:hypothetical protein|nr:hypothetical protein [Odoribacteraceae bacterium]